MLTIKLKRRCRVSGSFFQQGQEVTAPPADLGLLENMLRNRVAEEVYRGSDPIQRPPVKDLAKTADMKPAEVARKTGKSEPPAGEGARREAGGFLAAEADPGPAWVVIPTYNRPEELRRTLLSVADQADDVEAVVVIDDGSDDPDAVKGALRGAGGLRVEFIRRPYCSGGPNQPRIEAAELLPEHCMVVELDDHDLLCPGAVAAMRRAMQEGASFVYGQCVRFATEHPDQKFAPDWFIGTNGLPHKGCTSIWTIINKPPYSHYQISTGACYVYGARAYRRELSDYVGGWRVDEMPAGDAALFMRFEHALDGRGIVRLDRRLTWVRYALSSLTVARGSDQSENFVHYQGLARKGRLFDPPPVRPQADRRGVTYNAIERLSVNGEAMLAKAINYRIVRTAPHVEVIVALAGGAVLQPHFLRELRYCFRRENGNCAVYAGEEPVRALALTRKHWFDLGAFDERLSSWAAMTDDLLQRCKRVGIKVLRMDKPEVLMPAAEPVTDAREADDQRGVERRDRWLLDRDSIMRRNLGGWGGADRVILGVAAPHTEEITLKDIMAEIDGQAWPPIKTSQQMQMDPWKLPARADLIIGHGSFMRFLSRCRDAMPEGPRVDVLFSDLDYYVECVDGKDLLAEDAERWDFAAGWLDGVVTNSRAVLAHVRECGLAGEFSLHAAAPRFFAAKPLARLACDVCFCGAIYGPNKAWRDVILPAVKAAEKARIYGIAHEDGSEKLLTEAGAQFPGWLPTEDVPRAYASARVAVGVTKKRQQELGMINNRVFEVMAAGTPLVLDWFPALDEEGVSPMIWPTHSADEARETVGKLLGDRKTQREAVKRAKKARRWVKKHATYQRIARAVEAVLAHRAEVVA